ncbi:MAG: serine hydrolase [Candidatus Dormiibacterota bacterium]
MAEKHLWERLEIDLRHRVAGFEGVAGIALLDLAGRNRISIGGDEVFPTASTIKIAVLAHLLERAERGEVDLHHRIVVDGPSGAPGSGVLHYLEEPVELSVLDVAILMINVSDNLATNLCIDWATVDGVNGMLRRMGLEQTTLRRKMQDVEAIARGDENVATPDELVELLRQFHAGEGLSAAVCAETLRLLQKPKHGMFDAALPENIVIANKPGAMGRVRNDAAIVFLPRRPYVLSVMSAWGPDDRIAQEAFVADVAGRVHRHMTTLDKTSVFGQGLVPPPGF